ncbi:MAG: molybdopterin converting factor subunit 1 [Myxococcota bacterium]|nr:molybdopterin converting factor subunit 1 [Myxococcota bacterium]
MKVTVRLFGSLREEAGCQALDVELAEGASVADLRAELAGRFPSVAEFGERLRLAVNLELAREGQPLAEGDEVALLPPVAGGSGPPRRCTLSETPLIAAEVVERVAADDTGGVVTFVGTVRNEARGHAIQYLEYEAYPEMAEREMEKIAEEAAQRWPGTRLAIAHRVGHLEIGDAAVIIAACAPHRAEAFEACRFAIDTLKVTVPIWKKEVAVDGEYWVDDHA